MAANWANGINSKLGAAATNYPERIKPPRRDMRSDWGAALHWRCSDGPMATCGLGRSAGSRSGACPSRSWLSRCPELANRAVSNCSGGGCWRIRPGSWRPSRNSSKAPECCYPIDGWSARAGLRQSSRWRRPEHRSLLYEHTAFDPRDRRRCSAQLLWLSLQAKAKRSYRCTELATPPGHFGRR
jgi:hypothetical protein